CQPTRDLLERNGSVHQLERPATQAALLGQVRNVVRCPPLELGSREHLASQLRLIKMDHGSSRSRERFDTGDPSPNVVVLDQQRLKIYTDRLAWLERHRLCPGEE